jgi:hypothetical protein
MTVFGGKPCFSQKKGVKVIQRRSQDRGIPPVRYGKRSSESRRLGRPAAFAQDRELDRQVTPTRTPTEALLEGEPMQESSARLFTCRVSFRHRERYATGSGQSRPPSAGIGKIVTAHVGPTGPLQK